MGAILCWWGRIAVKALQSTDEYSARGGNIITERVSLICSLSLWFCGLIWATSSQRCPGGRRCIKEGAGVSCWGVVSHHGQQPCDRFEGCSLWCCSNILQYAAQTGVLPTLSAVFVNYFLSCLPGDNFFHMPPVPVVHTNDNLGVLFRFCAKVINQGWRDVSLPSISLPPVSLKSVSLPSNFS